MAAGAHIARGLSETIDRHASPSMSGAATVLVGALGDRAETLGAVALAAQATAT